MKRETAWAVAALVALTCLPLAWPSASRRTPHGDAPGVPAGNPAQITPGAPAPAADAADSPLDAIPMPQPSGDHTEPRGARARDPVATPRPSAAPGATNSQSAATHVTPQQALYEVQALVDKGTIGAARALAERYLRELPDGPEARQIMSLTGVHPHP